MKLEKLINLSLWACLGYLVYKSGNKQYQIIKENIQDYKREQEENEYFERMMFI